MVGGRGLGGMSVIVRKGGVWVVGGGGGVVVVGVLWVGGGGGERMTVRQPEGSLKRRVKPSGRRSGEKRAECSKAGTRERGTNSGWGTEKRRRDKAVTTTKGGWANCKSWSLAKR